LAAVVSSWDNWDVTMEWFEFMVLLSTEICELIWSIWPCRSAPLKNLGPLAIFSGFYNGIEIQV
jgi:hypothetical protein